MPASEFVPFSREFMRHVAPRTGFAATALDAKYTSIMLQVSTLLHEVWGLRRRERAGPGRRVGLGSFNVLVCV